MHQAANGETALDMTKVDKFDVIFVDQYMASIEKQMLGTETVRAMRSAGVDAVICGLSANNVEGAYLRAGADAFMFKPFPCQRNELASELVRILQGSGHLIEPSAGLSCAADK